MVTGAVCICSRGLIHSRTLESIEQNLRPARARGEVWLTEYTHDKPIPEAQNAVVEQALIWDPEWILFVEEDNMLPIGMLRQMRDIADTQHTPVVLADYKLPDGSRCIRRNP